MVKIRACSLTCRRTASCAKAAVLVATPGMLLRRAVASQMGPLLTYAMCKWLPELSRMALQASARQLAPGSARLWYDVFSSVHSRLPLLAWRCRGGGGAAAATGPGTAGTSGAAGAPPADSFGGWRLLLLEEVRAVPLLALRLAEQHQADP
ncbi:hypothetical protein TSOC_005235 [Tetrabaena socialis]|uniref:Uncharacterized protein n=1 Tax=Tetrabaena socialis TaxID=47790 RepID=A0A2J8A6U3_9CHLO|nr:hypothetical protein TSOC_005235 [Tetrabaena socialis]|eukprot:PNH08256.1 hypothetical protein TSOC_005235 [Tetrabaena socialis]